MVIGYDHHQIGGPLLDIVLSLVGTSFLGEARSRKQLLDTVLKLNTRLWKQLHAGLHGLSNFSIS